MKRRLLFGITLLLAVASLYTGVLGGPPALQYGLLGGCLVTTVLALRSPADDL